MRRPESPASLIRRRGHGAGANDHPRGVGLLRFRAPSGRPTCAHACPTQLSQLWRPGAAVAFVALSCATLLASPAAAIVSNPLPRICNEYPRSDYVFSGKVLSETYRWHEYLRGDPTTVYAIRVDHVFMGKVPRVAHLYTTNNSGRGVLDVGERAIVFADKQEGRMAFYGSSNSQSGAGVPTVVAGIRAYLAHPPKNATIAGRVGTTTEPLGGVRILVTNGAAKHFLRTDRSGSFVVSVPPGRWSVQIAEPGWASRSGVYSYDSAAGMLLRRGACADLQIEAAAPDEKLDGLPAWKRWPR